MSNCSIEIKEFNTDIYRYVYAPVKSNMYIIIEKNQALLIDPHVSDEAYQLLKENCIDNLTIILTHEHFDHSFGVNWFKERFLAVVLCQRSCAESIAVARNNKPFLIALVLSEKDKKEGTSESKELIKNTKPYEIKADIVFEQEFQYRWGSYKLFLKSIPGHTPGSCCIIVDDQILFTGDSLIKDTPVITRFPGGSADEYNNITLPFLHSLDRNMIVLPGHGDIFKLAEVIG
jgi:hydroxyacylglutathione hydrolase